MRKSASRSIALATAIALYSASLSLAQAPDTEAAGSDPAPNSVSTPYSVASETPEMVNMGHFKVPANIGGKNLLKATVTQTDKPSPLLHGSVQTIPAGTKVNFEVTLNINSEVSQKGDAIEMRIAGDVKDSTGKTVIIPGGWKAHGYVTRSEGQKRLDREGYVEIEFDKIVSPDGQTEVDFPAKITTKDSLMKSTVKQVLTGGKMVGIGAFAGSLLAYQIGGLHTAISTYGISIGVGAGIGGSIGLFAKLKKKGDIASYYPGDVLSIKTAEPIFLPGFDPTQLPSAQRPPKVEGLEVVVSNHRFSNVPWGDKKARNLQVDVALRNHTKRSIRFADIRVESERGILYPPDLGSISAARTVASGTSGNATLTFCVDSPKLKYSLVLYKNQIEVGRVPIN